MISIRQFIFLASRTTQFAIASAIALALVTSANAGYVNFGGVHDHHDFSILGDAWDPGPNTARFGTGSNPSPGGATWSVMMAGIADSGIDDHGVGANGLTTDLESLYAGGVGEIATLGIALDKWAAVSGFTNLGQATDGGGSFGELGAGGLNGDIRVGAIFIDGSSGVLAHAFEPGTAASGSASNIGGDTHFDDDELWDDCASGCGPSIDFHTVALHEFGHALGLGHSNVPGSVMEAFYGGPRRTLHADDIAGIRAIYGVPEPALNALGLMTMGLLGLCRRGGR